LTIQKEIRLALSHEGYEIQTVSDGTEAIEQLLLFRPQIVLIDVSLPGKSAIEVKLLADEKPELKDTRFVLMSSAFESADEKSIEKARFSGRLTKPFDPAHLRKVLSESLNQSPPSFLDDFSIQEPQPLAKEAVAPVAPPPLEFPSFETATEPVTTEKSPEADIRELTESTVKMTGMSDFEWSVNEAPQKLPEFGGFDMNPSLPPLPKMSEDASPTLALSSPVVARSEPKMDLSKVDIMVQQQVEAAISKLSREVLSEIAERVIKEEIHRLLKEGP